MMDFALYVALAFLLGILLGCVCKRLLSYSSQVRFPCDNP